MTKVGFSTRCCCASKSLRQQLTTRVHRRSAFVVQPGRESETLLSWLRSRKYPSTVFLSRVFFFSVRVSTWLLMRDKLLSRASLILSLIRTTTSIKRRRAKPPGSLRFTMFCERDVNFSRGPNDVASFLFIFREIKGLAALLDAVLSCQRNANRKQMLRRKICNISILIVDILNS